MVLFWWKTTLYFHWYSSPGHESTYLKMQRIQLTSHAFFCSLLWSNLDDFLTFEIKSTWLFTPVSSLDYSHHSWDEAMKRSLEGEIQALGKMLFACKLKVSWRISEGRAEIQAGLPPLLELVETLSQLSEAFVTDYRLWL